ncbi:MAG: energy transducer TonB, partial [Paracoccaceae bacterium]
TQASPAQSARGEGEAGAAGSGRRAETATLSQSQRQSLTARWGGQVRAAIERRKRYPGNARGASGTVVIRITVGRDGSLRDLALARSSGSAALDDAALRAVKSARRFPPAPEGLTDPTYSFNLPMNFGN